MLPEKVERFDFHISVDVPHTFLWYQESRTVHCRDSMMVWPAQLTSEEEMRAFLKAQLDRMSEKIADKIIEEMKRA